jgi:hypothetical protein
LPIAKLAYAIETAMRPSRTVSRCPLRVVSHTRSRVLATRFAPTLENPGATATGAGGATSVTKSAKTLPPTLVDAPGCLPCPGEIRGPGGT